MAMDNTSFLLGKSEDLAAGIRTFRAKHELSQAEMARLSGVSLRTLQYLEGQGVQPNSLTILKLGDFMRRYERAAKKVTA